MLEKDIERKVNDHAKETGWLQYKFTSPGMRGVPDRIYFFHGHTLCIEFKKLGARPSALQLKEMRRLKHAGITCLVIDNVTEGRGMLDQLRESWDLNWC